MSNTPELFLKGEAMVGEGPIVDGDSLLWIDIPAGQVNKTHLESRKTESELLGTVVGAIAPLESSDGYAVACKTGFATWEDGVLHQHNAFLSDPEFISSMCLGTRRRAGYRIYKRPPITYKN